ncbi:hypothetical protein EC957_010915 [Mortierella hygrophila]|uniref:F-box domain-containing protein n=1 Tax=Mortierella hygrophila TaxID=979708 RepID=A0A9P6F9C8_9FUNG|nr:hypothetical protein EC957_010915 [Mortierella hygrophila]
MDPLSQLPLECLHMVISILKEQGDTSTLASLIRTNKHIASSTLPFLYSDPYQWAPFVIRSDFNPRLVNTAHKLTCLLLHQIPVGCISPMLTFAFPDLMPQTWPPSTFDYLRHIRHLRLGSWAIAHHTTDKQRLSNSKPDILEDQDFQRQWQLDHALIGCESMAMEEVLRNSRYWVLAFQEANWALASPILEQLRSLTIPVSDIQRYHGVVSRLRRLESVDIVMDTVLTRPSKYRDMFALTSEQQGELNSRLDATFKFMISFFRDHAALFPNQLKTAQFHDGRFWMQAPQQCPDLIQFKVFEMLPPLARTRILTTTELLQSLAHPLSSAVSCIKDIVQEQGPKRWLLRPENSQQYLQQCRSLKSLALVEVPKGIFSWAADERLRKDKLAGDTITNIITTTGDLHKRHELSAQDSKGSAILEHHLPPLSAVTLQDGSPTFPDDLDDLAFAFSKTLRCLTVRASTLNPLPEPKPVLYGQRWVDLPVLTHLSLDVGYCRLVIDRALFTHCPNLETLALTDNTMVYYCRDLVPCLPADFPRINKIQLKGWSALTFDAATLHTTPNLTDLSITMHCVYFSVQFIPPLEELDRSFGIAGDSTTTTTNDAAELTAPAIPRSVWTWDWYLPQLKTLTLTVEFALRFQFRMLRGCPSLHILSLDCSSVHKTHMRTVTTADLFSPTSPNEISDNEQGTSSAETRITAPALQKLTMFGRWVVQDAILSEFLTGMFPELQDLTMARWSGCTLEGFVDMVRTTSRTTTATGPQPERINKFKTLRLDFHNTSSKKLARLGLWKCGGGGIGKADAAVHKEGESAFYLDRRTQVHYRLV